MVNAFLDGIINEGSRATINAAALIAEGEGSAVEFKQTARLNIRTGVPDKAMEAVIVKTVAGFLNAHGGTLLIGVTDAGAVVGLSDDIATLTTRPTLDGYEQFLRTLLTKAIGADLSARVEISFPFVNRVQICAVRVPSAARPVWVSDGASKTLYVRSGNLTQPLDSEAAHRYLSAHYSA
jgi:predicted HTH transcriptional regulator